MMKKILCVLLFLCARVSCAWGDVQINAENFPDDVFREYVRGKFDKDSDDILNEAEIARAEYITVGDFLMPMYGNISSLKGVEYFTALISLKCAYNKLTELDLSKNTALEILDCWYNHMAKLDLLINVKLYNVDVGMQNIRNLKPSRRNDGTYYTEMMNDYGMTPADLNRIIAKSVKGYDRAHHNISTYNATSGIVSFSSYPAELRYSYDTASGHSMDVIIKALPLILTEQPDDAYVDVEYSFKFKAGGAGKISWDIYDSSKLPQGLEFDVSKGA